MRRRRVAQSAVIVLPDASNPRLPTPVVSTGDSVICRQFSIPQPLDEVLFGWLERLTQKHRWYENTATGALTVAETVAAFEQIIDDAEFGGRCHLIGEIVEIARLSVPDWLLRCDGATYANADYPELAAVIHGGLIVDDTHFRVPDRVQRHGVDGYAVGTQGGEQTHTQTIAEMPTHHHTDNEPAPEASAVLGVLEGIGIGSAATITGDTGTGDAFNVLDPYEGTEFYIVAR